MSQKSNVAIIGCGAISGIYIQNCYRLRNLNLVALADLDPSRPAAKINDIKAKWPEWKFPHHPAQPPLPRTATVEEVLADPSIEIIINLTVPKAHASVALQCLKTGKHTYHEKPFAITRADGQAILDAARPKDLRVGCAPDTFLGAGIQTCRKIIDDGWIGTPIAATAFMTCPGHESWHPDPEFYYQLGGGPLFDMGPYYLTALINLIGPIKRVTGFARATYPTRTITSPKKHGQQIPVETPTHIASTLEFANHALATMVMSFDIYGANLPRIEIYGTHGSLSVPDPNTFGGEIKVKVGRNDWATVPHSHGYKEDSRGLGVADLASALHHRRAHRATGELAFHVLDIMQTTLEAASQGKALPIQSTLTDRPTPLPLGLRDGEID